MRLIDHPNGNNIQITFDAGDSDIDKIRSRHDTTVFAEVDITCDANQRITKVEDAESNDYDFTYSSGRLATCALPCWRRRARSRCSWWRFQAARCPRSTAF